MEWYVDEISGFDDDDFGDDLFFLEDVDFGEMGLVDCIEVEGIYMMLVMEFVVGLGSFFSDELVFGVIVEFFVLWVIEFGSGVFGNDNCCCVLNVGESFFWMICCLVIMGVNGIRDIFGMGWFVLFRFIVMVGYNLFDSCFGGWLCKIEIYMEWFGG